MRDGFFWLDEHNKAVPLLGKPPPFAFTRNASMVLRTATVPGPAWKLRKAAPAKQQSRMTIRLRNLAFSLSVCARDSTETADALKLLTRVRLIARWYSELLPKKSPCPM